MSLRDPDETVGPFREQNTPLLTAIVKDNAGVAIPGASLDTMVMTLFSEKSPYAIINSRDHTDIKSHVDSSGQLSFMLTRDDMKIVDGKLTENHRMMLEWTWNSSTGYGSWEIRIIVSNLEKVS